MKKLFIIGVSGLTGFKLANLSINDYKVFGTYNHRYMKLNKCEFFQLDKTDKDKTKALIERINPDVIVDCSALHNVDFCEKNVEKSWSVNVDATINIAETCKNINARMIFISTDYVFDGQAQFYTETSKTNPLNVYGEHKLKAEEEIIKTGISYAIARTSLIFGWNPGQLKEQKSSSGKTMNYVIWALKKLRNNEPLKIVSDQFSTPTFSDNLAEALLSLAKSDKIGLFNMTGKNCVNRFDLTLKIAEVFGLNKEIITPTTSDMFEQIAKRPMRCCLNNSKAEKLLKVKFLTVEEALMKMKKQEK